ncbi:hypothetical protein AAG906_012974 [Vitis piasezkii]
MRVFLSQSGYRCCKQPDYSCVDVGEYILLLTFSVKGLPALHLEEIVSRSSSGITHIDVKAEELQSKFSEARFKLDAEWGVMRHPLAR